MIVDTLIEYLNHVTSRIKRMLFAIALKSLKAFKILGST